MYTMNIYKKLRIHLKMSQQQLAKKIGVTVGAISNYENSRRKPINIVLKKYIQIAKRSKFEYDIDKL